MSRDRAEELYAQLVGSPPWDSLTEEERAPWVEAATPAELGMVVPLESGQQQQDRIELAMQSNAQYLWRPPLVTVE